MHKPYFSIIIPTLNEEDYLPRLLKDLSLQKFTNFEVIVVDGGSEDKTVKLAESFKDKLKLKVLAIEKGNVSKQRNLGAQTAQSKYFIFFDADIQVSRLFLYKLHEQVGLKQPLFFTTYVKPDSDKGYDEIITNFMNLGADLSSFIERPFVGGWAFMVERNAFFNINGFREDVVHGEDSDLAARLGKAGYKLTVFNNPKVIYSLRRFRKEGRLITIRKHSQAALHLWTDGPITKNIFEYPMGGDWYKKKEQKIKSQLSDKIEMYVRKLVKILEE